MTNAQMDLVADFSRSEDFPCVQYCQPVPTNGKTGIWYQMRNDGERGEYFQDGEFRCERYGYSEPLTDANRGDRDRRYRSHAQRAMAMRTINIIKTMTDEAQYPSTHIADLSVGGSIVGVKGNWAESTTARMAIHRTLDHCKKTIFIDTSGQMDEHDLKIVMSPETARAISLSQEMVELRKTDGSCIDNYNLPERICNVNVVIERAVKVSSVRSSRVAQFAMPFGTVLVCHRPEGDGVEGGRSFATCSIHVPRYCDLSIESKDDAITVADAFDVNMTNPLSGFVLCRVVSIVERTVGIA